MNNLLDALLADQGLSRAVECFNAAPPYQSWVYGVTGTQKNAYIAAAYRTKQRPTVIITAKQENIEQMQADLSSLLPDTAIVELPPQDIVTFRTEARSMELAAKRMDVFSRMVRGETLIILATAEAAMQKVMSRPDFESSRLSLFPGLVINSEDLIAALVRLGYERLERVDSWGQFSARGGIIDIFPINRELPVRLEYFGDEIDSLREYDPGSQRSVAAIDRADIFPLAEPEHSRKPAAFLAYLPEPATVVFDEPARIREQMGKLVKENPEIKQHIFDWLSIMAAAQAHTVLYLSLLLQKIPHSRPEQVISITANGIAPFHRQMNLVINELTAWQEQKACLVIFMSNREKARGFKNSLSQAGLTCRYHQDVPPLQPGMILVTAGLLAAGFELPHIRLVVLTERDIFGQQRKRLRPRPAKDRQINYFRDIKVGDYVVHVSHGIGKYVGVETLEVGDIHRDYLHIRYAGEDKLYVPTDQVHLLQKYIGAEGEIPRLHKLGGSDWLKAKSRAKAAVTDLAKDLLVLYAERRVAKGYAFAPDTPWQTEFEEAFPYEETPDQLVAIDEIKRDMEKPQPMDRLLCGDVGFGKTEVAIRTAFKAVMSGKQVAVLVPTTVLAQQHFQTFTERFGGFGLVVDVISRFRTGKEQQRTLAELAAGRIDVLIGTHRILQPDVLFKDLGLLIVDEEQRFGVSQKERIKKWCKNIDVLTLSATPIPRTLHMSLVGVRDMSVIETPPEDRFPVQTYVIEFNEDIIRNAIRRELKRGGQVYLVYNRVQTIDKIQQRLVEMLPDAKIRVAHGQMPEELLEQVMLDFYEGYDDVLVCTSIIENGLDVPNANTIIVYDADRFGLSQLYQMRGRVGRSHRMAYAYFTYRQDKVLTEVAEKRLQAIKEFTELGAGFKIAMRDLEIRGAGNLLGAQQHGHIVNVGFEMYCRLLEEAVRELETGKTPEPDAEPVLELKVEAYLSGDYIPDPVHKIELYQRIAAIRSEQHISDLLADLIDRFGDPPAPVANLLMVARIKNLARQLGAKSIIQKPKLFEINLTDQPNIDVNALLALKERQRGRVAISPGPPGSIRLKTANLPAKSLLTWLTEALTALVKDRG